MANPYPDLTEVFPALKGLSRTEGSARGGIPLLGKLAGRGPDNLKEQIVADIEPVFVNLSEFAEDVDCDGVAIRAVVEEVGAEPFGSAGIGSGIGRNARAEGVFGRMKTLYASNLYFPAMPLSGDRVRVNGELWTVSRVTPEGGMLVIELKAVGA